MIPFVDLFAQYQSLKSELDAAIQTVITESAFVRGRFVEDFERGFATATGMTHCISCANGTDALYIVMRGLGVSSGDEVITTAHSWIATSETITQAGGKVVFCDTDGATYTIDPRSIESKITPRTVGIIPVHLYGQPADMDPILAIAKRHNLWVVEDCAQAHMARYKGRLVGTFGAAATFSFYPGKNLGAMGDAGCIVTNDARLAQWCELFARHGGKNDHIIEGINSRMDGIQAAILTVKLPHLDRWTKARQALAAEYTAILGDTPEVGTPTVRPDSTHVYHLYVVQVPERDRVRSILADAGIATIISYPKALPFYPAYQRLGHRPEDFPNAYANQQSILSLPLYPEMLQESVGRVCDVLKAAVLMLNKA